MYLVKTIKLDLYDTKVKFIVTSNIVRTANKINAYHRTGVKWKKDEAPAGCTILCSMATYYILIDESSLNHNTIFHEVFHCVSNIASDRGVGEEEAKCWIQGLLGQEIYDFLKFKQIEL